MLVFLHPDCLRHVTPPDHPERVRRLAVLEADKALSQASEADPWARQAGALFDSIASRRMGEDLVQRRPFPQELILFAVLFDGRFMVTRRDLEQITAERGAR